MTNRQLEVLTLLLRNKKTTITKLAKELNVNTRTVERNINKLTSEGVPITTKQGRGGGVYIEDKYKIDKMLFTERDIHELFTAINIYNNIFHTSCGERMSQKIILLNPESTKIIDDVTKNHLIIDLFEEKITVADEVEAEIRKVLAIEGMVRMQVKVEGALKSIKFFPLAYILKKEGVYLYGFYEEYMLIPTDQIIKVELCEDGGKIRRSELLEYKDNKDIKVFRE